MKAIITGATGMIGKGVLLECLDHKEVTEVLVITRNPTGETHPKLMELIHKDFTNFDSIKDQMAGYDACYHCMGVSAATMNEANYTKLTYEVSIALANTLYALNPNMTFIYVSGVGTDSSEKGRQMWARVKGKTENDLLKIGFKQSYMFRPGMIVPLRGIKSRTKLYQFMYDYFMWLLWIVKAISPSSVIDTTKIGLAMIEVTSRGFEKPVLTPMDINECARSQS
ncbi:MAG: epimerase [Salibacteraceae bacterium]